MIAEQIKDHFENKKYGKIKRSSGKHALEMSNGYIVDYSDDFILLNEAGDFEVAGYLVLPIKYVKKIRYNKWDKYFEKILISEGEIGKVGVKYKIDLSNWKSVFESIKGHQLNVIVKCEDPKIDSFNIGLIINIYKKDVEIHNFDPSGLLDEKPTLISYKDITAVSFDDRYINIFSKYLRSRKPKK